MSLNQIFDNGTHKMESAGTVYVKPVNKMTINAFLVRIDPEAAYIDLASIDTPDGTSEERMQQAELRKLMRFINSSPYIDKTDPILLASLNSLVAAQLMTQARADEVLNTPITTSEEYKK
jgi:hypothetical protein